MMTGQQTHLDPRELDAALAKRVLGWKTRLINSTHWWARPDGTLVRPVREVLLSATGDGMLLVLDAMQEWGWGVVIIMTSKEWAVHVQTGEYETLSRAEADTLPHAVALAALTAMEVTNE